jgi:hypothetical protein
MLHPDRGGDTVKFQELQRQFESFRPTKEKYNGETADQAPVEFMTVIENLIHIPGIMIEIIGSWIWISGDTKPVSELIKVAAKDCPTFRVIWNKKRKVWQIYAGKYRRFHREDLSKDEIVSRYGSQSISSQPRTAVN